MKTKILLFFAMAIFSFSSCENEGLTNEVETSATRETKDCETAFAYDKDACCFLDDENLKTKRWGWSIGPIKDDFDGEYDIYQAAAKCNLDYGTLIGQLYVSYIDGTVTVEYDASGDFHFFETHLYIGNDKYPTLKNGKPTVAPGQYPYKHDLGEGESSDYFEVDGFTGDIYIIAHAVVCPKKE